MNAKKVALGLSNFSWHRVKAVLGPTLRFSRTMKVELEDGRILGDTIPGFICTKLSSGEYKIHPPIHRMTPGATYRCALITKDDADLMLKILEDAGYLGKIGVNVKTLRKLPIDLSELPANLTHED